MENTGLTYFKLLRIVYSLLLLTFIIPSGVVFFIPVKIIISLFLLLISLPLFFKKFKIDRNTVIVVFIVLFLIIWSFLSIANGYTTYSSFLKNYLALLFIVWISYELYKNKVVTIEKIFGLIKFDSISIIIIKIFTSLLLTMDFIHINDLVEFYDKIFNCELTTMYFPIGNFTFYRLMVANDGLPYIYFSFYLLFDKNKLKKILLLFLIGIYTFITYSRVYMIQCLFIIVIYIFIYLTNKNVTFYKKLRLFLLTSIVLTIVCITLNQLGFLEALFKRFNSDSATYSDNIREEQFEHLMKGFKENFLFGNGTGAYIKNYLRSDTILYSYELEYLSFLYQFGLIGFILIILPTIILYYNLCFFKNMDFKIKLMLLSNFLFFLVKPLVNPGFLSSNAGFLIVAMFACTRIGKIEKSN